MTKKLSLSCLMRPTAAILIFLGASSALLCAGGRQAAASKTDATTAAPAPRPFIALAPSVVMLKGQPGESFQQTLGMTNGTPIPLTFRMVAMDVVVKDGKRAFVQAGETPGSVAATAVFTPGQLTIPPHQAGKVNVTLTATPESSIRAVVVEFHGMDLIATPFKTRATATASLGALVTFSLSGNVQIDASALQVQGQSPTANAAVTAWLRNSGSEPGVVAGEAAILTRAGQLLTKASIPQERLLPGERLPFKAELPVELRPGQYRVFATFLCDGKTTTQTTDFDVR